MTRFRLATATVLLAGLALPVLAQGTAAPAPAAARTERAHTPAVASASAASVPAAAAKTPVVPVLPASGSAGLEAPHAAAASGTGRTIGAAPAALSPRADTGFGEAREGRAGRTRAEQAARSRHRFAAETRMERERTPHVPGQNGEVAPVATR